MRLSDVEIKSYLAQEKIVIAPAPDAESISGVTVDVRLGNKFRVFEGHNAPFIDISGPKAAVQDALDSVMSDE
ncbi:MAG: dCTP deaminase domain-containing protein, partial [Psychrobium sp.]